MSTYILNEAGEPVRINNPVEWGKWYERSSVPQVPGSRIVAQQNVGGLFVSTVFLGIDHNFGGKGGPVLWETMVFRGTEVVHQDRYTTRQDAEAGHQAALELARSMEGPQ